MDRQTIQFSSKDSALREDVHALGGLIGEVLADQGGPPLLTAVEGDRLAALGWRDGDAAAGRQLEQRTSGRSPELARDVLRAFGTWFSVVNLAEKVHRIRRRRQYLNSSERPQPGSIADCLFRLKAAGVGADEAVDLIGQLSLHPVFTAHPTESTRRTLLRKQQRIANLMVRRLDPTLAPQERSAAWDRIRTEITSGWQTEEHPRERLSVADEREHVLFYMVDVMYQIVPQFYEEIEVALERVYGIPAGEVELPIVLRFGTWVGGDMDGNPDVHAKSIRETLLRQQQLVLNAYYEDCLKLAAKLTQSASRVGITKDLQSRIDEYTVLFPSANALTPIRHDRQPYRTFLGQCAQRLRNTYEARPNAYESAQQLERDLELVADSLKLHRGRHAGLFSVERLLRRIRTFGFHLATLDVRQHADVHRDVIAQGLGDDGWASRSPAERLDRLRDALARDLGPVSALDAVGRRTLAVFEAMAQVRHRFGAGAIGEYVISGAAAPDDVMSVLLLARWADITDKSTGEVPFDIVPLFETLAPLEHSAATLTALYAEPAYQQHLGARRRQQTVLIGYSDSNKESGLAASRFALYGAQDRLAASAQVAGVDLTIFHGRGGTTSRGGGRIDSLVRSVPPGSIHGRLRMTEQGEVVNNNYGLPPLAMRTFEQGFHAVALAFNANGRTPRPDALQLEAMATVARVSRERYRGLVYDQPGFVDFFRAATPIDVIERMQIGSRPAVRPDREGLDALRAVPWVFAWTQTRHLLPGWFGVGSGLDVAAREHGAELLSRMRTAWPFFYTLIEDTEQQLARADLDVAARYERLAGDLAPPFADAIRREFALTRRWVTWLKGSVDLLDSDPLMQRSIMLRAPYSDPLHLMQIDLLSRWRATGREDRALFDALLASIGGIAQALQSTG